MSIRKSIVAAVWVAAVVVGLGSTAEPATATAAPNACPGLYVVAIPGTWETSPTRPGKGMLAAVTKGLPSNIRTDYVSYAATAYPWEGDVYGRSKREAVDNARGMVGAMAQRCGATKIAIIGYSQGADAAGDLAAEIGTGIGVVPPGRIAAVGLISDPRRSPADAIVGPHVDGAGASGPRIGGFGWLTPQTRTFCAVGDLYCATSDSDFITRFAGFMAQVSGFNMSDLGLYQREAMSIFNDLMASGGIPVLQNQLTDAANEKRARRLQQFFDSLVHQDYPSYVVDGSGATATSWLRHWLVDIA